MVRAKASGNVNGRVVEGNIVPVGLLAPRTRVEVEMG
jgi:hypothetical protein